MKVKRLPRELPEYDVILVSDKTIPDFLKHARLDCGLTQAEMAEMLGFESSVAISLIEKGARNITAEKYINFLYICGYNLQITE